MTPTVAEGDYYWPIAIINQSIAAAAAAARLYVDRLIGQTAALLVVRHFSPTPLCADKHTNAS
jgi:hypothetical protein